MRRRSRGQSIVEMAFIFPLLVLVMFGIIDLGYYVYGYATIYQAARTGSEKASMIPPYSSKISPTLNTSDLCVSTILDEMQEQASLFPDLTARDGNLNNRVQIRYPSGSSRTLGSPIEVAVTYPITPLTPLWQFVTFGSQGTMTVKVVSRRSIEALGNNPNKLYAPNLIACSE